MEQEEWRPVVGYEDRYQVSNLGRLRRSADGYIMRLSRINGSVTATLRKDGKARAWTIARLVAVAFLGAPDDQKAIVGRKDRDRMNNRLDNLFWAANGYTLLTPEAVAHARAARSSPEARAAMAKHMKGPEGAARLRKMTNAAALCNSKKIICLETGVVYPSIKDATAAFGLSKGAISTKLLRAKNMQYSKVSTRGKQVFHFKLYNTEEWRPKECIWKPVPVSAVAAKYEVSNMGEVRRISDRRPLVAVQDKNTKYCRVSFFVNGGVHNFCVHKLVADAFLPKQYGMDCVGHRDGNRSNNCVTNLYRTNIRSTYRSPINKANYAGGRKPRTVVCIETGAVYKSLVEASKACHITERAVANACKRYAAGTALYKKYTTKGKPVYHFRYADQ